MLIPIRCWTCGKPLAQLWEEYQERTDKGENPETVMNDLGLERYCCKGQLLGTVELIDTIAQFKK